MDDAKYHWPTESLKFYYEKEIRVIDWLTYSPDLNQIENLLLLWEAKLEENKFTTMNTLKYELLQLWSYLKMRTIKATWESIFKTVDNCLELNEILTNY